MIYLKKFNENSDELRIKKEDLVNYAKDNGFIPLLDLKQLGPDREVYGIGWNGIFQKGIVDNNEKPHVVYEQEYGGVRGISKNKSVIDWDDKVVFPLQTVESELYIKE